jgi:uncharacterized protein (TIGR03790 family)
MGMRNRIAIIGFFFVLALTAPRAAASTSYNDVAVVVNTNSATSQAIGAYFKSARNIPSLNMIYVAVDTAEEIDSIQFGALRSQIESYLTGNHLTDSINYIVTTKGVPLKVNRGNTFSSTSPSASVESELALVLGPYSSSIGGEGRIISPLYNVDAHMSRVTYGIYLVTRLDGYTLQDVLGLIDRSGPGLRVDPTSMYVFDQDPAWNGSIPALNNYLATAKTTLDNMGKLATLDQSTTYLTHQASVIGYTSWGSNDHYANNFTTYAIPHNTWAPGAIAETYVSTSARSFQLPAAYGQSLIADLIHEGISGAKGYVYEPYSSAMAIAYILFDRYARGYNLAESYSMASRYCSWMDVIIGDPKTSIDGGPASPLPIQLCHFEARIAAQAGTVRLTWGTLSELNNYGFFVQHRDSTSASFSDLPDNFIPGNGTTLVPQEYAWVHGQVATGLHYYRLRQMDLDGTVHCSEPVSITISPVSSVSEQVFPTAIDLLQNFPNPFNPSTTITFDLPHRTRVDLRVYNSTGEEVATLVDGDVSEGRHTLELSGTFGSRDRASGVYFYRLRAGGVTLTRKMMYLK